MAKRTAKTKFNIMNVIQATAGGAVANAVMDLAEDNVTFIKDTPYVSSLIPAIIGSAGIYFTKDDKYDPIFYGMMGASGAEAIDESGLLNGMMDGFSRVNYIAPGNMPSQQMVPQTTMSGTNVDMIAMEEEFSEL